MSPFPESTAYLDIGYQEVKYDDPTKFGGPNRDNSGFTADLGATKTFSDLWTIELGVGYRPRNFDDKSLENLTGAKALSFFGNLGWNITRLTTVNATVSRLSTEATEQDASAVVSTFGALNVEHQLLRSLTLNAGTDYNFSNFEGSPREDRDFGLNLGLQYNLVRYVSVRADYGYRERDSTENDSDYDRNTFYVGLQFSL